MATSSGTDKTFNYPTTFNTIYAITSCVVGATSNSSSSYNSPQVVNCKAGAIKSYTTSSLTLLYTVNYVKTFYMIIGE